MASWIHVFTILLLQASLLVDFCRGAIKCVCTTTECIRDGETFCMASHMCYVQYLPQDGVPFDNNISPIVRGCIDERTPLLCENRRPQSYTGSWPVLHCCKDAMCNKDVLPTRPSWIHELENKKSTRERLPVENSQPKTNTDSYVPLPEDRDTYVDFNSDNSERYYQRVHHSRNHRGMRTINPLYIGVPIAGACVLLAIIIFAIYVLKRQNQYIEEYRYHSTLRHPPHNGCVVTRSGQHGKKALYAECERSSSGSETKLLMKV